MTTFEFTKAKMLITSACNSTGLELGELVGVLSSVLEEARAQMSYELAGEIIQLQEELDKQKEVDTNGNSDATG